MDNFNFCRLKTATLSLHFQVFGMVYFDYVMCNSHSYFEKIYFDFCTCSDSFQSFFRWSLYSVSFLTLLSS